MDQEVWGDKPWENEIAQDFCDNLDKIPITKVITNGLKSGSYNEQRAAAWMLTQLINIYPMGKVVVPHQRGEDEEHEIQHTVALAIKKMNAILDDTTYFGVWGKKSRPKVRRNLRSTIMVLENFTK